MEKWGWGWIGNFLRRAANRLMLGVRMLLRRGIVAKPAGKSSKDDHKEVFRCSQCHAENAITHKHCSNCGVRLVPVIKVSKGEVPERELREFIVQVCDQHFENGEVVKRRVSAEVVKEASDSLQRWFQPMEIAMKNFLWLAGIVAAIAAFFGIKTIWDIENTVKGEKERLTKEFQGHIDQARALRDHLQRIIQVTRFVPTETNEKHMTPDIRRSLEKTISEYRDYLLKLRIVPDATVLEVDVDSKYAGIPGRNPLTNTLQLDPLAAQDSDLVCRFYTQSLFPQLARVRMVISGLAFYFPCSWQNDARFAETYAGIVGAVPHSRLNERDLRTLRRFSDLSDADPEEVWGEIWGAIFWHIREILGQPEADHLIAKTALDFIPRGLGPSEERRFVTELLEKARLVDGGKRVSEIKGVLEKSGWKF